MNTLIQNQGYLYTFSKESFGQDDHRLVLSSLKKQGYLYLFSKDSFRKANPKENYNTKNEIITTLIADDHPYLIHGVESDLNKDSKIKIVGTANSYDEVILKTRELQPCIVLLDLRMPERDKYSLR